MNIEDKKITFYACAVDFEYEMGEACDLEGSMPLYSDIEDLKEKRKCVDTCGIVKLELSFKEWMHPQDFGRKFSK
jgi:hypothetical protein